VELHTRRLVESGCSLFHRFLQRRIVMRQRVLFIAASMALAGFTLPAFAQDATGGGMAGDRPADRTGQRTDGTVAPNGTAKAPDAEGIRDTLASATEAAITKDGFDDLIERFVDADRDRLNKFKMTDEQKDKLNGRIAQLQKDWKAKYNQDFDIDKEEVVFNDQFRIVQGEIGEAQPAGGRMDPTKPDTTPGAGNDKAGGGDANRDAGRNVAKVTVPASHGMPAMFIPFIHEMPDAWKIDVPDTVEGQKLYDNLLTQLTMVGDMKDQWPSDVNDAYRAVSHHVMMAVLDQNSGMMKPGDKMPATPSTPGDRSTTPGTGR